MINIEGYSLAEKAQIVANEILRNQRNPLIIKLARELKTPEKAYEWIKRNIKYKKEVGDVLYEPEEVIKMGWGDCEDLTVLIGAISKAQGYPVRIRIVKNRTRHIYPLVKINGKWKVLDLTPHRRIPYINGIPKGYVLIIDGIVSDEGLSGLISGLEESIAKGAGTVIGSTVAKVALKALGIGGLSGIEDNYETVKLSPNYNPKLGDHLLFYFKPKWYIPDRIEKWLLKKVVEKKIPNAKVLRAYFKKDNNIKHLIVEVVVTGEENLSGIVITIAAITAALLGGAIGMYFTLDKIEKVIEKPQVKWPVTILSLAILAWGIAKIVRG